jgi:hypothetical protein
MTPAPVLYPRSLRLEWVTPDSVADNPKNWRRHPELQLSALGSSLDECNWAGALLYNEYTSRLIDGHARKEIALKKGIAAVPVLVGSWTPEVEAKILATLDPLAAMAETNAAQLTALLRDVETGSEALATLLARLADEARVAAPVSSETERIPEGDPEDAGESKTTPTSGGPFLLRVSCPSEARRVDLMAALRADGYDVSTL